MANTDPTFLRRFSVFVSASKATTKAKTNRLESVTVTLGFRGPVDPESGMIVNLIEVDAWIEQFKLSIVRKSFISRVDFCKKNRIVLQKLIGRSDLNQILFSFHDFFIFYKDGTIFFGWHLLSEITSCSTAWLAPITITFLAGKRELSQLIFSNESIQKKTWQKIKLKNYQVVGGVLIVGARHYSFEYEEPILKAKLKIFENDIILK